MSERYRTIVADPPWPYSVGWPGNGWAGHQELRTELPYDSMSLKDIAALRVADMADEDAHLLLWTTNRYVRAAYDVVDSWGFHASQLLTWCKPPQGIGPGGVFAQTCEFVLYARRGKPVASKRQPSSWFEWPRHGHSVKPEAFLDMVEAVFPGPYLELFARRNGLGWDTWGNESLEHVTIPQQARGGNLSAVALRQGAADGSTVAAASPLAPQQPMSEESGE